MSSGEGDWSLFKWYDHICLFTWTVFSGERYGPCAFFYPTFFFFLHKWNNWFGIRIFLLLDNLSSKATRSTSIRRHHLIFVPSPDVDNSFITGRPGSGFCLFVSLFLWFCFFSSHSKIFTHFFTHLETSPLPVKGCNFDLCPALMAIEQWGFYSVPHLLWHGAFVYNGHLRRPVTLLPSVWQWCCHYLFLRPVAWIRAIAPHARGWVFESQPRQT